jgi:hypothetical protein
VSRKINIIARRSNLLDMELLIEYLIIIIKLIVEELMLEEKKSIIVGNLVILFYLASTLSLI